jgi:superfamily II DNA/RNA helicase
MNAVIGKLLRDHNIGFVELSSKVAVKNRDAIIQEFEQNPACKVFLSTEAGGSGLNLQVADTVINFELPWNPAKKNQRIGRIDRIGQQSNHLTVINLITRNSIEERINTGLALKQAMFDGVLSEGSATDHVDFSAEGRAQFLQQLQSVMGELLDEALPESPADGFVPMWSDDPTEDLAAQLPTETATEPESKPAADSFMDLGTEPTDAPARPTSVQAAPQMAEMELVMNNGLGFIAGLFKMMTGKELSAQDQKVEVNQETGEVTLKFKLPK